MIINGVRTRPLVLNPHGMVRSRARPAPSALVAGRVGEHHGSRDSRARDQADVGARRADAGGHRRVWTLHGLAPGPLGRISGSTPLPSSGRHPPHRDQPQGRTGGRIVRTVQAPSPPGSRARRRCARACDARCRRTGIARRLAVMDFRSYREAIARRRPDPPVQIQTRLQCRCAGDIRVWHSDSPHLILRMKLASRFTSGSTRPDRAIREHPSPRSS